MEAAGASHTISPDEVSLLLADHVLPLRPVNEVLEDHAVVVGGSEILAVLPAAEARRRWPQARTVDLAGHALLPGLVNAHTHAPMSLLRGYADDLPLNVWLKEHIWPAEQAFVGPRFVAEGTRLAVAEMLRSGTTCFNDMYFFADAAVETCVEIGMRASIGITVIDFATAWAKDVDEYISKGLRLREARSDEPLISFTLSPHAPYTVCDRTLERIAELSGNLELPVHMHLLETEWEIKQSYQQHDMHPISRLERFGLLGPGLHAVHMTQVSAEDIDKFARAGAQVVHCPQSNLKLASGMCPVSALQQAGVNVALGTDGAASNNDLDMLSEAQTAALLAKGVAGDARAVDAFTALEMMTLNGARALGLDDRIGSIEPGKQADLCALDLRGPETRPLHHVVSQIIYAASSRQVTDVWVAGRRLLDSGELTSIDLDALMHAAARWQSRLSRLQDSGLEQNHEVAV